MSVAVSIGLSEASRAVIARWKEAPQRVVEAIDRATLQLLAETTRHIKENKFAGSASPGGGRVGTRSGDLKQDLTFEQTGFGSGTVGTTARTANHARTILGPDDTTIRPRNAKDLWIPIAKNLNPSGVANYTPRALFDTFGERVRIFTSKQGNKVVFVEDERNEDGSRARYKRATKERVKGDVKGKLYFVLKDQVVIHGTDALAQGVREMDDRGVELYGKYLREAMA